MIYALFLSLILTGLALGQPVTKPAPPVNGFTSVDGRFSVSLPKETATFEPLQPGPDSPNEKGGKYIWVLPDGVITIDYSDDPALIIKTEKDYADLADGFKSGMEVTGSKTLSFKPIKLGVHRGFEMRFQDPKGLNGVSRILIVNQRRYTLFGMIRPSVDDGIGVLTKAFDSFKVSTSPTRGAAAAARFTSPEGRYSIALAKDIAQFEPLTATEASPRQKGGKHIWATDEGVITVDYNDDPDFVVKTNAEYAAVAEGIKKGLTEVGSTIVASKPIRLGAHRGYEIKFVDADKRRGMTRMLIVKGRKYMLYALAVDPGPTGANFIVRAFDSFKLTR
jgi:hypothetical protein